MNAVSTRWASLQAHSPGRWLCLGVVLIAWLAGSSVRGELTADQKRSVVQIATLVKEAGSLFQAGDFEQSGQRIEAAMSAIDQLVEQGGAEAYDAVAPVFPRIVNAHALLELEGVRLPPFERPERPEMAAAPSPPQSKPSPDKPTTAPPEADTAPDPATKKPLAKPRAPRGRNKPEPEAAADTGPSFIRQIGPILVQHCGNCHIGKSEGNFSLVNFAMLAKGPPEGTVIFPGDAVGSRLIETIESGDMPRGGGQVPAAQLQLIKDWIIAGAKYDGNSPLIPLVAMAASAPPPTGDAAMPAAPPVDPSIRQPTGSETVSFAKDIAPILIENCNGCHINAMQTRGGLRLDDFASLMRGGDNGEIVMPMLSADSLLVRKLKGEEGQRMPAGGRPPLSDEQIALISKWIDENATFDGATADQPLGVLASLAWAGSASDKELSERRAELARKNLRLVAPGEDKWIERESKDFFLIGNLGEATADVVIAAADKVAGKIKSFADPTTIRGRVTIVGLPKRYDYSEFCKMVESRAVPTEWQSHWKQDGVDAYIAIVAGPSDSDDVIEARLVGPLTSLAVAMRGSGVPRWLAEGVGRAATAKIAARDFPNVESWNQGLPAAVAGITSGDQFVKDGLAPEQTDLIGYAIATTMLRGQRRQYDALLKNLEKGEPFDAAFTAAFGGAPAAYVDRWKPAKPPAGGGQPVRRN
jgi:mono/diheme cytochrome c family protein